MSYLYIDLETRSECDLKACGPYVYGAHPTTEILCACLAVDDGPVETWRFGRRYSEGRLLDVFGGHTLVAHNIDFEWNILCRYVGVDHFAWLDTAALAARMSLPRKLEELAAFLFPDVPEYQKDMEGNRVMMQLCKPRRPSKENPDKWWTPERAPEKFEKLYAYCAQDVEVMRACHKKLLALEPKEQKIWALTQKMNERGVKLDVESIPKAQALLEAETNRLTEEFVSIVGCSPRSPAKVAEFFDLNDSTKYTIRNALKNGGRHIREPYVSPATGETEAVSRVRDTFIPYSADDRRALELKQQLSRSSTAKLEAMQNRVTADGRLHGALTYCGAERTGRWAGQGVQLQNLTRGLGKATDDAFNALDAGCLAEIFEGQLQGTPERPMALIDIVAEMLRGFLVGPFLVGDYAQIEARVLAWYAGQNDLLKLFADHGDPYCAMASRIYGRTITKADKAERFMGKQVVLGCGYGMGPDRFQGMLDEIYDVQISDEFARKVIRVYRNANSRIVHLWDVLQKGFHYTILHSSKCVKVGPVFMGTCEVGGIPYVTISLPSGRKLYYARPEIKDDELRYFGRDIRKGGWCQVHTHGGKIAENITQALSRDLLAEAMLHLEDGGMRVLLTVHDEVVVETEWGDRPKYVQTFKRILEALPPWAAGLPVEAEVFTCQRYRK